MLDDEIGMHVPDIQKHINAINSMLSKEDKLYNELININSTVKDSYKSQMANFLNSKNDSIALNVEIKKANLKSYEKYVEKMINAYQMTSNKVIEMIKNDRHKMN